jgi:hypothetical protein
MFIDPLHAFHHQSHKAADGRQFFGLIGNPPRVTETTFFRTEKGVDRIFLPKLEQEFRG